MITLKRGRKCLSSILIFLILLQSSGCMTTRVIYSVSEISDSKKYSYIIHSKDSKYQLLNTSNSNGVISGNLTSTMPTKIGSRIHIYLMADSALALYSGMTLVLPADRISKIELKTVSKGTIVLVITGIIVTVFSIVAIVSWQDLQSSGL